MSAAPLFYSPEAQDALMVQCPLGHEMSQKAARLFGRISYATYGCCYCGYSDRERQLVWRAYEIGIKADQTGGTA